MPSTYQMQRTKLRYLALPSTIQSGAAIILPAAAFVRAELMGTTDFGQIVPKKETDYDYAGKGNSFTSDSQVIEIDSTWDWSSRCNEWNIGWLLAMVLGVDTFTAGAGGANNTHVFTFADNTNPAPMTNIYTYETSAIQRQMIDMALKTLVLTADSTGSIKFKASFIGTGRYQNGAIANPPALETSPTYLRGSDAQITLGPIGEALPSIYPRVRSWEATFDSGASVQRRCGAGLFGAFIAQGNPTLKLKLAIDADSSADIDTYALQDTQLGIGMTIPIGSQTVANPQSLVLSYPLVVIPKDQLAEQASAYVGYNLEFDEQSILKPQGNPVFTATLSNTASQYLTAYAGGTQDTQTD